jgi:hypothetical protein
MKKQESPKFEKAKRVLGKLDPYVGIVLEEIQGQLSTVIEGNDALEHKIDRVDAELQEFRAEANEKFEAYSEDMKSLRETKADKTEVAVLERRVTQLEKV